MSAVIEVEHLSKEFRLGQLSGIGAGLRNTWRRARGLTVEDARPFKALDDLSFSIQPGEVVGLIGHNGAGKSTLLKILAGISKPTKGRVRVAGRVAPMIEVGAGLVPDMTGRENVFLNASILGMARAEIRRKFDEIVAFSELEDFIDTPVKRYSSGMQIKLGFSIATAVEAEILIVDEVLSVGDLAFQRKSFDRMESLIRNEHRTVLLVSHNIRQVERVCSRAILLDHGTVLLDGQAGPVGNRFYELSDRAITRQRKTSGTIATEWPDVELLNVEVRQPQQRDGEAMLVHDEPAEIVYSFRARKNIKDPTFGLGIHTTDLLYLSSTDTDMMYRPGLIPAGEFAVRWNLAKFPLLPGIYAMRVAVASGEATVFYAENTPHFRVTSRRVSRTRSHEYGFVHLEATACLVDGQGRISSAPTPVASA